jgi:hypothetical protein
MGMGSISHKQRVLYSMGSGSKYYWKGVLFTISQEEGQNTIGRGFNTPWVGCLIFHKQGVRYTMGRGSKYNRYGVQYAIGREVKIS